jgi:hypothetical protein
MANTNFVIHNGLTVGPTTIDAASGNIAIPVGKQITIGNVLLRDNGQGRLAVRDITDNSDVVIDATVDAGSTTAGNIQIGTNHIESTDANGPISLRPNGAGNIAFSANTIMVGKGGAFTEIGTGIQTDPAYGINYTDSHLRLSAGRGTKNVEIFGNVVPTASNTYTLGNTTNWWSKSFTVSATAQYADLAENYTADAEYTPGTVVHFGGEQEVSICDVDMCSKVAGVVSTNPAYLMNGRLESSYLVAVALVGRVPTKVRGPVRKGDLMVSAGDGHARAENLPRVGTVIGKALEDFNGDTGVIEVVVGKH